MTSPPRAPQHPHHHTEHGVERPDPWHWLKDRDHPDTLRYLHAENAYTQARAGRDADLRTQLYDEMLARIEEDDTSVPWRKGEHWYLVRTVPGKPYALHCRRTGSLDAPEVVLLDENAEAEGHDYFSTDTVSVSPDGRLLAWSEDTTGAEQFVIRVRDLTTGEDRPDRIEGAKWGLAWGTDGSFYYTRADASERPHQIWRHVVGTPVTDDVLVLEEPDERFFVGPSLSRDERWVVLEVGSKLTSEAYLVPADAPLRADGTLDRRRVRPRVQGVEYDVEPAGDTLYLRTNAHGPDFAVEALPVSALGTDDPGAIVIAHEAGRLVEGLTAFERFLVVWERAEATPRVTVIDRLTGERHTLDFDEPAFEASPEVNPAYDGTVLRLTYTSPITPRTVLAYDLVRRTRDVLKVQPVRGGYDPSRFVVERLWAPSVGHDGVEVAVPVTFVRRADRGVDEPMPVHLIAYGAYGFRYPASFASSRLSLLERGVAVAIAHARGGSELGRRWWDDGKLANKINTFTDVIAVADHLVGAGRTTPDRLHLSGGSAGGLMVGAVINQRPELFAAATAHVPFVDTLNTMLDASLPLTVTEYEEWGNPTEREGFDRILAYSPYDHVHATAYPHLYVTGGLTDPRVGFWEPAKWVAKLRATKTDDHELWLRMHMGAGHAGQSGRYGRLEDQSWDLAWILRRLGVVADPDPA